VTNWNENEDNDDAPKWHEDEEEEEETTSARKVTNKRMPNKKGLVIKRLNAGNPGDNYTRQRTAANRGNYNRSRGGYQKRDRSGVTQLDDEDSKNNTNKKR